MKNRKILIIDDDIQIGNLEQEVLEKEGYECIRAYSGTEAVLLLEKQKPDLIILDLMLPGLSGEEVLSKTKGIPVIVVSAKVSVDDKVSNIAHDLRTPLTAISGYLDLLEEEKTNEKVGRYLDIIRERTENLIQLTEELFRYSVITSTSDEMKLEKVSLRNELEVAIAGSYGLLTEKNITPEIELTDLKVERVLDSALLQRIFGNIISNAAKYSEGDLKIKLYDSGKIVFQNRALGLTKVEAEQLFDRFYTVNNAKESTGLGLSIAKMLTEKMGGKIYAEWENGIISIILIFYNVFTLY